MGILETILILKLRYIGIFNYIRIGGYTLIFQFKELKMNGKKKAKKGNTWMENIICDSGYRIKQCNILKITHILAFCLFLKKI